MGNHLYWSASSTPDGNGELIREKWMSLDNHIHNKHKDHSKEFPMCKHKHFGEGREKRYGLNHVSVVSCYLIDYAINIFFNIA